MVNPTQVQQQTGQSLVAPMGTRVPVPPKPDNFREYMEQLASPIRQQDTQAKIQEVNNKMQPYAVAPTVNLQRALGPQVNKLLSNETANQKKKMTNTKLLAGLNQEKIKYQQALLQQELAERSLYTKYATERLQASAARVEEIKKSKIDPSRFFKDMPTWQKIIGFVGVAAAGIMHARAGYDPNEVVIGLNNLIEQDVVAQTRELEMAKWEHQQININDVKQLGAMKELISSRSHIRTNLAALVLGEITDLKNAETDQKKASELGMLHQALAKSYIQKSVEDRFKEQALSNQIKSTVQLQVQKQAAEKFAGEVANANSNVILGPVMAQPGDQPIDEKIMAGLPFPDQVKTGDGQVRALTFQEKDLYRHSASLKGHAQDLESITDPKRLDVERDKVGDWKYTIRNLDVFSGKSPIRSLQGSKIYSNWKMPDKQRTVLLEERRDNMDTMKQASTVAMMLGGLPIFLNQKVGDEIDLGEYFSDVDDGLTAARRKIQEFGVENLANLSTEQKKELLKAVESVNASEGSKKYNALKKRLADAGVSTDAQVELLKAYAAVSLNIKMLTARAIAIVTGEEGKRKTKEEQEMAMRFLTGGPELNNWAYSDLNIFQRAAIIATGASSMATAGIETENLILGELIDPGLGGHQIEAAKYKLNDSALYKNNKVINLIRELHLNHGLNLRPTDVESFQNAIKKWYDIQSVHVQQNDLYRKSKPMPDPDGNY